MKEAPLVITRETTIWRASQGFHASHSLGAMLFGFTYLYLAFEPTHVLRGSVYLLGVGFLYLAAMVVLARKFWFSVPFRGVCLALVCYIGAVLASAA